MSSLSEHARTILARLEPGRHYDLSDVQALAPGASLDGLRESMHELWINRYVERDGYSGWRRHRSAPAHEAASEQAHPQAASSPASAERAERVRSEDLFDHDAFATFFK